MKNIYKNKKAETSTTDFIISMILFSGIIALLVISANNLSTKYSSNITSEDFSEKFNKFENNTNIAKSMWDKTTGEGGLSTIGSLELLFASTVQVISLVFSSVTLAGSQMFSFTEYFGIPSNVGFIFASILFAILMVFVIFRVINSLNRRDL